MLYLGVKQPEESSAMTIEATIDGQLVRWRDSKRYLWLMGAIIPLIPLAMWGLYAWTGSTLSWFFGPFFVFVLIPLFDLLAGLDPNNPPDEVIEALEKDRYYRWVTYAFIPMQLIGLVWGALPARRRHPARHRRPADGRPEDRPRHRPGHGRRHRHQHRARAGPQEGADGALVRPRRAGPDLLRPLLHRAQPRPPRPRRHAAGPGQRPPRRDRLGVLPAHRVGQPEERLGSWRRSAWTAAASRRGRCTAT